MKKIYEVSSEFLTEIKHHIQSYNRPVWLVPYENSYSISVSKPNASELPFGTTSYKYDSDLLIVESIKSSKRF